MNESIGPLLFRLRTERGRSQLRLAEMVCAAAGASTVSRHEISRWERETRIPSRFWLRWLAHTLEADIAELEQAAGRTRADRLSPAPAGQPGQPAASVTA